MAYQSPNACNLCHTDQDAAWADKQVRNRRERDFQAPVLYRAGLIDAARKRDWTKIEDMIGYLAGKDRDEVFAASLIRLLMAADDDKAYRTIIGALEDSSPLVRAAAVEAVALRPSQESLQALVLLTGDASRLVRVRAAAALAAYPQLRTAGKYTEQINKANEEYLGSLSTRMDLWTSHYNLGNYQLGRNEFKAALASYGTALKIEPHAVMALVNSSIAHAKMGANAEAEQALDKALKISPENGAANFNMGLLKAEKSDIPEAEKYLKAAIHYDPQMAQAAYNLCILTSKDRIEEAIIWCEQAASLRPWEPRYAYTLGFFQVQRGDAESAERTLATLIARQPTYLDGYALLADLYEKEGKIEEAKRIYEKALAVEEAPEAFKSHMRGRLGALKGNQ
jgi:tetratricopeptide (TPR) repeat protein